MSILIFLVVLAVLILAHEFGHFIVAKRAGIRVDEFGLGFPPRLLGIKKGETLYSLNAIPFGGFVKIYGENPDEETLLGVDKERAITAKPKYIQAGVIVAGVVFNVLLAWLLISGSFMSGLPMALSSAEGLGAELQNVSLTITDVSSDSPAALAGFKTGDTILSIANPKETKEMPDIELTRAFIADNENTELSIVVGRGGSFETIAVTPISGVIPDKVAIGIGMEIVGIVKLPPHEALFEGAGLTISILGAIFTGFGGLLADVFAGKPDISSLTGPIGIVGMVGDAAEFGFVYLMGFTAFISLNLAVFNLIPFPALDGGRLLFLLIETVKGTPVSHRITNLLHTTGFALLILLLLVVSFFDLVRYGIF